MKKNIIIVLSLLMMVSCRVQPPQHIAQTGETVWNGPVLTFDSYAQEGTKLIVPVRIQKVEGFSGVKAKVLFKKDDLQLLSVDKVSGMDNVMLSSNVTEDGVTFVLASDQVLNGVSTPLITLTFFVLQQIPTTLSFDSKIDVLDAQSNVVVVKGESVQVVYGDS